MRMLVSRVLPGGLALLALMLLATPALAGESPVGALAATDGWFHSGRTVVLVATALFIFLMVFMIYQARTGKELYIRPIAGIQAVEEAIGRATEMAADA